METVHIDGWEKGKYRRLVTVFDTAVKTSYNLLLNNMKQQVDTLHC